MNKRKIYLAVGLAYSGYAQHGKIEFPKEQKEERESGNGN